MTLTPGTRLGPHEILAPLGAGGMGEVYRGRDTRLGRDVAIKALPAAFAQDPERLARFEREAKLLASLSHTNIAGIHGLEEVAGERYLVLEYVEGETLAARVARGPIPADEACEICRQVAAGVEAAHESGIVHRDLKPGNIMLTPSSLVKVLDFGLAKGGTATESGPNVNLSASPTLTQAATGVGVVLGTAAYMSPEQARGRPVDRRTDVWSFGCVLYECLTGRQAYEGETVSDLIARILEREPDWSALPPATPPRVIELLRRCLTKDVTLRLREIGEARIALAAPNTSATGSGPGSSPSARRWVVPAVAAVLAVVATAATLLVLRPAPAGPVRRFALPVDGLQFSSYAPIARTRDGIALVYEANDQLWIRRLDQLEPTAVPGSKGGRAAFWSWDQKTLGFGSGKKLWRYELGSDRSQVICEIPENGEMLGAAWGPDGRILFAVWRGGIYEVPAGGGDPRPLMMPDSSTVDFHGPSLLPDGRTLLVFVHDKQDMSAAAVIEGSPPRLKRVFVDPQAGCVAFSPTGHLLFTREKSPYSSAIWAVPFSAERRKASGPGFLVLDGAESASGSSDGLLVAAENEAPAVRQLVWKSQDGGPEVAIGDPEPGLSSPALSPDGRRVAYAAVHNANSDIWVRDLVRGTSTRLVSSSHWEGEPVWSKDGSRIYYTTIQNLGVGSERIVAIASDGAGSPDTIVRGQQACPAPDGRSLVYTLDRRGNSDLWVVPLDQGSAARPFLETSSNEKEGAISPDGRWVAYASDESGRDEIYIRRYPEGDRREQVSIGGGTWPRWMPRGDAIVYLKGDTATSISVGPGPNPVLGQPRILFSTRAKDFNLGASVLAGYTLDPSPDGSRFIGLRQTAAPPTRRLLFVENWLGAFQKR